MVLLRLEAQQTEQAVFLLTEDLLCLLLCHMHRFLRDQELPELAFLVMDSRGILVLSSLCWDGSLHTGQRAGVWVSFQERQRHN
jgi:hypothetical protein